MKDIPFKFDLEKAIDLTKGHIYWKDSNLMFRGCNQELAKFLGLADRREIVGKNDYDICPVKEEADRIRAYDQRILDTGEERQFESSFTCSNGEVKYFLAHQCPIFSEGGKIIGVIGTSIDITAHKKLHLLEKKYYAEEERTKVMSLLANSIAHELRTPLASMTLGISGLKKYIPILIQVSKTIGEQQLNFFGLDLNQLDSINKVFKNLEEEVKVSQTIVTLLVDNVMSMRNDNKLPLNPFEIDTANNIIEEALRIYFNGLAYPEVRVNWDRASHLDFKIFAQPRMIVQVLINLLKNAGFFIKSAGRGEINIWLEAGEEYNYIYLEDTALGIKPEDLPHVFEQFFSKTKSSMGLGLAFCKTMMTQVDGNIECFSEYKKYTRFKLSFPTVQNMM